MDIKSKTIEQLHKEFEELGEPRYRAQQVYKWLHSGVTSFEQMTNISKNLKEKLSRKYYISVVTIEKVFVSRYDDTRKYLLRFNDGLFVEAVFMKYRHGCSVCISTQVGCKMGCSFCATGKNGFKRNLSSSEMISQIQAIENDVKQRISNVVLMGMGEPLDNYQNVITFLKLISSPSGMNIGIRHISLSTCGLVDKIYSLAKENLGITLSISLHAPNDAIRNNIMKINSKFKVAELIKACDFYTKSTKRRISYEYAMIKGINDSDQCALELAKLLKGKICHVNLIPVNEVEKTGYKKSKIERLKKFKAILENYNITTTIRRTLGSDIQASCGQLVGNYSKGGN